jgi:hypothetical protein
MVRAYEILIALALLGTGYGVWNAAWTDPGDGITGVPKDARTNPSAYRSHYRHVIIRGGK